MRSRKHSNNPISTPESELSPIARVVLKHLIAGVEGTTVINGVVWGSVNIDKVFSIVAAELGIAEPVTWSRSYSGHLSVLKKKGFYRSYNKDWGKVKIPPKDQQGTY